MQNTVSSNPYFPTIHHLESAFNADKNFLKVYDENTATSYQAQLETWDFDSNSIYSSKFCCHEKSPSL